MIPFFDAKLENSLYEAAIEKAIRQVIDSGCYLLGEQLEMFEYEFSQYCDVKYTIGVGSGTEAIILMLEAALQIGMLELGDEIIVPTNSFTASAMSISRAGLQPVFADVDPVSLNLSREAVENALTGKTRAILAVHLYGQICNMDMLSALCKEHDLYLFEDTAQALGARWQGQTAGSHGVAAAFSFYPTKNLGCLGDAGAITTSHTELASVLVKLRNYGSSTKYNHEIIGANSRIDEFQASILRVKLPYVNRAMKRRCQIALVYNDSIENNSLVLPVLPVDIENHSWHLYVARCQNRDEFVNFLNKHEIECGIHYPKCIHEQVAYSKYGQQSLPYAESAAKEVFSLPISASLSNQQLSIIIDRINQFTR